jgi:uncharacterized protein with gpF-like domain
MASRESEGSVYRAAKAGLQRFLQRARDLVMAPFTKFGAAPNADAIYAAQPIWHDEVERIVNALTPALQEGWAAAHLPGDYLPSDPYIQANLALTRNLLVGIPDEVHALVVREILAGTNAGEDNAALARRVDSVLDFSGSENWDNRAKVIAQTETNRHYNSSLLAHALLVERQDGASLTKEWQTRTDGRERAEHHAADHQVRTLSQPYMVGGEPLLFPGDPAGLPHNVINCRCGQTIQRAT